VQFGASFYRAAAICSALSAITTLCLIFLPSFFIPVDTFDERMARVHDPAYALRSWVYLVHGKRGYRGDYRGAFRAAP
jgi:hypothetical protein